MKKYLPAVILFIIFAQFIDANDWQFSQRQLEPIEAGHYFKMPSDIVTHNDTIFITDNFKHKLLAYELNNDLHFSKALGGPGQGPGDFTLPVEMSTWKNKIAVKDQIGFSFFTFDGKYISKFRSFGPWVSFVYLKDNIYNLNIKPQNPHLITVYSMEGKKTGNIGKKYLPITPQVHKKIGLHMAEKILYGGKLLTDGEFIYYFNMNFGTAIKISADGKTILKEDISHVFGEMGKFLKTKNEERLKNGIKIINGSIPVYKIFKDVYLHKNKIYFFGHDVRTPERTPLINRYRESNDFFITIVDLNSFTLLGRHKFRLKPNDNFFAAAVKEIAGAPVFLLVMGTEEGNVITELKVSEVKNEV